MICGIFKTTGVRPDQLAEVMREYEATVPAPQQVTSSADGAGKYTVTATFQPCPDETTHDAVPAPNPSPPAPTPAPAPAPPPPTVATGNPTPNFRSLVSGGFFSSTPYDRSVPTSIRCNNPGAINGAPWESSYPGFVDTVETTPGNKTTIFEAPEYGVAVWWELLRLYQGKGQTTLQQIITTYGGGQNYQPYVEFVAQQTGLAPSQEIKLDDDATLLNFAKAMYRFEAGRTIPWSDAQILFGLDFGRSRFKNLDAVGAVPASLDTREDVQALQSILIRTGYLDPPADGGFGEVTKWALRQFAERSGLVPTADLTDDVKKALANAQALPLTPGDDLAGKVVKAMLRNNYWIARHPACVNIVYVEGMNPDGSPNDNRPNVFNDTRLLVRVREGGVPVIVGAWEATTEPGTFWTDNPMNPGGAFHIKLGQYKAWIRGAYHTQDALIQAGDIEGYRDPNRTYKRDLNYPVKGSDFGVEQHGGYDLPHDDLGKSSAGCLVGRLMQGQAEFMSIVKDDARYKANPAYRFMTAIMPFQDLAV